MSVVTAYGRRIASTAAGIGLIGACLATGAYAAPAAPPTLPTISDLPVPVLVQPVDASNGLLGIPRGAVPGIGTTNLQQIPGAPTPGGSALAGLDQAAFLDGFTRSVPAG